MKKAVNIYIADGCSAKQKIDAIKKAGFDGLLLSFYAGNTDINLKQQVDYAASIGLEIAMIHCDYNSTNLNEFWRDSCVGDSIERSYAMQIEKCAMLNTKIVLHLDTDRGCDLCASEIGLNRLRRLLRIAKKHNVVIAVENIFSEEIIDFILNNINDENLTMCLDVGHINFLTPKFDAISKFGNRISCVHLHDNDGLKDQHLVLGQGLIDLNNMAKKLSQIKHVVLCGEIKMKQCNWSSDLDGIYQSLVDLDNKISQY